MNGVPSDYEADVKQAANGTWYCNKCRCSDDSIEGMGAKLHLMMSEIEQVLLQHNVKKEPSNKDVA